MDFDFWLIITGPHGEPVDRIHILDYETPVEFMDLKNDEDPRYHTIVEQIALVKAIIMATTINELQLYGESGNILIVDKMGKTSWMVTGFLTLAQVRPSPDDLISNGALSIDPYDHLEEQEHWNPEYEAILK